MTDDQFKIANASDLRGLLGMTICGILEGRVSVPQGNCVAALSGEVHKSIRQEFDMRCYVAEGLTYEQGVIVRPILEGKKDDG